MTSETYIKKLKHILPTFFAVTFGTIIGLGFIRWLFCIQFSIIDIDEQAWTTWIPILFPWIPITIWVRKRFRALTFIKDSGMGRFAFLIISWSIISLMLSISQDYLTSATGKLKILYNINDIETTETARYYKLANFSVAPYLGSTYTVLRKKGKTNQLLEFNIYFVSPIFYKKSTAITEIPKYWYGVKFKKQINIRMISYKEKVEKYKAFYNECIGKMNKYQFHLSDYFERIPASDDKQYFLKAIEVRTKQPTDYSFIILKPIQGKFEDRNGNKLACLFGSFAIGLAFLLLLLILPGYAEKE